MVNHAAVARDATRLSGAEGASGGKPVLLLGNAEDRRLTLAALANTCGSPTVNLNIELAQLLMEVAGSRIDVVTAIAAMEPSSPVLLLDRIQILMLPQLRTNATDILCRVARRRRVFASWPGRLDQGRLRYADLDHPEYVDDDASRALVLDLSNNEGIYR